VRSPLPALLLAALCAGGGACAAPAGSSPAQRVQHVVLIKLREPATTDELVAACRELADLPSVASCRIGRPLDIGRSEVAGDWDVGVVIEFASTADYQRYLADERHAALVATWKPHWERITIHDVLLEPGVR
jgi:hypothetical protein